MHGGGPGLPSTGNNFTKIGGMSTSYTNGFNYQNGSTAGRLGENAQLISDEKTLKGDMQEITREDLRERLFVAEKVMKTLFQRNKQLEEGASVNKENLEVGSAPSEETGPLHAKIAELSQKVKSLESAASKAVAVKTDAAAAESKESNENFRKFMAVQLEESQATARRHFNSYTQMRDQYNQVVSG